MLVDMNDRKTKGGAGSNSKPRITLYDHAYETLAIQFVAATLKKNGFPTEIFYDCSMNKDYLNQDFFLTKVFSLRPDQIARAILATSPDVVGFSVITVFYPEIAKIMRCIKERKPDVVIICGGPHCILAPEHILENPDVDFIFRGDSDYSLPEFLNSLSECAPDEIRRFDASRMPGISNMLDGAIVDRGLGRILENLDEAPFPEKGPYYKKNPVLKILYTTTCSRGCIFRCTYCNSNNIRKIYSESGKKYFRTRSVSNVMEELSAVKVKYGPKYIMFLDNLFAPNTEWLREFSESYRREIGKPFFCETNPNVHTRETIDLLADAGCHLLQFGFQSTVEEVRINILHRKETNDRIRELVTYAKQKGMYVCVDHIANLPGEKKEHLEDAVKFYGEIRPNWINLGFIQYYPQAEILEIALAHRAITKEDLRFVNRGEHQSSFRLLSKSGLGAYYRTLPIRLFSAFKLPPRLGGFVLKLLDKPTFEKILSSVGSIFIYASRILCAYTDQRDFLVRHHVLRNLNVMKIVFIEKYIKYGGRS